ncbi:MAG: glycosyltransferase [Pseudomonadota bacterium]
MLSIVPFDHDRRLSTRLMRVFDSSPFVRPFGPALPMDIRRTAEEVRPDFVFLNQDSLAAIAPMIRPHLPAQCRIVVLSHGLESTDLLHQVRLREVMPSRHRFRPTIDVLLGRVLHSEQRSRRSVDAVCAISPFDCDLEQWLGTRNVGWLPRIVEPSPLAWQPAGNRFGFVGTLDHAPNFEGLFEVLGALHQAGAGSTEIRIVGGPSDVGGWFRDKFPMARYLGPLDDEALGREASTWTAFIHPIFCLPRGCSTKLATGMAWQIPIVTTPQGRRGYEWREGCLLEADTPREFVECCLSLQDGRVANAARADVERVVTSSPSLADVAARMRGLLAHWTQAA